MKLAKELREAAAAKEIVIEEEIRVIESESIVEEEEEIPITVQDLSVAKEKGKGSKIFSIFIDV